MPNYQPGILAAVPPVGRYLFFNTTFHCQPARALRILRDMADGDRCVVGIGAPLVTALNATVAGLETFPAYSGAGFSVPSTQSAVWCWLRGDDRGELVRNTHSMIARLAPDLQLEQCIDAFKYRDGHDLSGYEDGTENPEGEAALSAAFVSAAGAGFDGGSFVAVQQWLHDFATFDGMTGLDQDNSIGRRQSDNEELADAPASAHVKRTAQESFSPEAFVLRRSMPWSEGEQAGLIFVAFGKSTAAFSAQLQRMIGAEDGIVDALFRFTRPVTGSYFWCPPVLDGRIDLRKLGL